MRSQDPGEELYTKVFSVLAPYTDYQQPEFEEATCLTPIEWLYAVTSVALGSFLVSFLQELGKKTADEVAEYIKKIKAKQADQTSKNVASLFTCEILIAITSVNKKTIEDALSKSSESIAITLKEYRFPKETLEEVQARMRDEVKNAIAQYLGNDPQRD